MRKLSFLLNLLIIIAMSIVCNAETYWIDDTGTQISLANCKGSTPLSGASACAPTVNWNTVVAGDIVYFRGGTYSFSSTAISPSNSGTSGSRITFAAYNNESVIFNGTSDWSFAVKLESGQDYITVRGIRFQNFYHHVHIEGTSGNYADYNEIDSCTFTGMDPSGVDWRGSTIEDYATYNWIHNCTFEKYGDFSGYDDVGVVLELGWDSGVTQVNYNVIENNILQSGGHHVLGLQGYRNVVRNNYIQNNRWSLFNGNYYGCKVMYSLDRPGYGQHLVESNRVSFADQSSESQSEGEGYLLSSPDNIIRYNVWDNHNENAFYVHKHGALLSADGNHVYNNTFWYNGHDRCYTCSPVFNSYSHAIVHATTGLINYYKNNLFYDNLNEANRNCSIVALDGSCNPASSYYANNYEGAVSGNPLFVNISGTPDPSNRYQFDFNLQSISPAINGGTYLTQANGSGSNSTTLVVNDAKYFQPGWGNGAGGGAVVYADWIAIGTVTNGVQISSINYGTNTITLASPMTWSNGASVWLYKNSSGTQVLYGSAPDYGAYEFGGPPSSVQGLTITGGTLK